MSEHGTPAPGADTARCPACGARVVPSQDWCGLCLQPLRAAPVEEQVEELDPGWDGPPPDVAGEPVWTGPAGEDLLASPEGEGDRATAPPGLPPGVAEAMLAELAATSAADRPLARGPLAGMSRGGRLLLGCGAGIVLVGIVVGLLALVGLLLP